MALFTVVPDKSAGDVFTEAMWDTFLRDNLNDGMVRPIAHAVVTGSPVASIDFLNIPATFAHLLLVCYLRTTQAVGQSNVVLRLNNDSGGNYDYQSLNVFGITVAAAEAFAQTSIDVGIYPGASAGANLFGQGRIEIVNYANAANNKMVEANASTKSGTTTGSVVIARRAGGYRSNTPVSRATILAGSGSIDVGSLTTLYGMGAI